MAAARELPQLVTICGIKPEQEAVAFSGRYLGADDAKLLAFDLSKNQTIKTLKVNGHVLRIDELKGTKPVESIDLSGIPVGHPDSGNGLSLGVAECIIIAACIKVNVVLKELNLQDNQLDDNTKQAVKAAAGSTVKLVL